MATKLEFSNRPTRSTRVSSRSSPGAPAVVPVPRMASICPTNRLLCDAWEATARSSASASGSRGGKNIPNTMRPSYSAGSSPATAKLMYGWSSWVAWRTSTRPSTMWTNHLFSGGAPSDTFTGSRGGFSLPWSPSTPAKNPLTLVAVLTLFVPHLLFVLARSLVSFPKPCQRSGRR